MDIIIFLINKIDIVNGGWWSDFKNSIKDVIYKVFSPKGVKRKDKYNSLIDAIKNNTNGRHDKEKYEKIIKKAFPNSKEGGDGAYLKKYDRILKDQELCKEILGNTRVTHRVANYV